MLSFTQRGAAPVASNLLKHLLPSRLFHDRCFSCSLCHPPPRFLRRLSLFWLGVLLLTRAASDPASSAPATLSWNPAAQGGFVVSLCRDRAGNVWAGTEDKGVWRYSPATRTWTQFTAKDGLGDDNAYSLTCDKQGRVWAGTLNHGVSVFNGKAWRTYDQTNGPLGAHVVALTTSPIDGDVWGATEAGLFRYSLSHTTWTYFTRADGLPSDQADALAFASDGTLYVGTQCDGIAIASPADGYKAWHTAAGRQRVPYTPTGDGLPSSLINALLVGGDGSVYAGTTCGLARSKDGGKTWRYIRGLDWADKARGAVDGNPPEDNAPNGPRLREDYVTALAEDGAGHVWVGHRQASYDVINPAQGGRSVLAQESRSAPAAGDSAAKSAASAPDYTMALLPFGSVMLMGGYGSGLTQVSAAPALFVVHGGSASAASFPAPALPPSAAEMDALAARVQGLTKSLAIGSAVFAGQDWTTQGDWVGRYGRQYARLSAMQAPWGDHFPFSASGYTAKPAIGPHRDAHDALRSWVTLVRTDKPKSLYDPVIGYRRQAEWDDHGESRSQSLEGPDVWLTLKVPEGIHRVSLYFMNKDGHAETNRDRDYLIEVKPSAATLEQAEPQPTLAQARVKDFWDGVYPQFVVRGPSVYRLRISRNNSFNTIVSGMFVDKLVGKMAPFEDMGQVWMGEVRFDPPAVPDTTEDRMPQEKSAQMLWSALDAAYDKQEGLNLQNTYRLLAYRVALNSKAEAALLTDWRWKLGLWLPADRTLFTQTMAKAYQSLITLHPALKDAKR